jgi:hypothetical protein
VKSICSRREWELNQYKALIKRQTRMRIKDHVGNKTEEKGGEEKLNRQTNISSINQKRRERRKSRNLFIF